jgi:hypothetical protein
MPGSDNSLKWLSIDWAEPTFRGIKLGSADPYIMGDKETDNTNFLSMSEEMNE